MLRTTACLPCRIPPRWCRAAGLAVLLGVATVWGAPAAFAQRPRTESLEQLRATLDDYQVGLRGEELKKYQKERTETLGQRVDALRGLGEMSRAILLPNWQLKKTADEEVTDQEAFNRLTERFNKAAREVLEKGGAIERIAMLGLLDDMAEKDRRNLAPLPEVRRELLTFTPDVSRLARTDDRPVVQAAAALALANLEDAPDKTVGPLTEVLTSGAPLARKAAAEALALYVQLLAQRGKKASVSEARERVVPWTVADAAVLAIPAICEALKPQAPLEVRRAGSEGLKQITALVFESLPDVTRRAAAGGIADQFTVEHVKLLGRLSDAFKQQGPVLASAVIDKDPAVRLSTLYALEEVANAVRKYQLTTEKAPLPDKSPPPGPAAEPRALAVHIALRETIPAVRKELFDPDVRVRRSAVNVLEFMGPDAQDAVYDLVAATRDKDLFVRWSAVRALGALISRPSTKPLLSESELDRVVHGGMSRLLEEPDVNLRLAVLTALGRLGPRARAAVPVLWETVNRSDSDYRVNVLRTLQSIGPAAVEGPAGAVVTASGVSLPAFAKVLADPDTEVRKTAAETFGRFADALKPEEKGTKLYRLLNDPSSDVRSALIRLLDDPDTDVRRAASEALLQVPR